MEKAINSSELIAMHALMEYNDCEKLAQSVIDVIVKRKMITDTDMELSDKIIEDAIRIAHDKVKYPNYVTFPPGIIYKTIMKLNQIRLKAERIVN